MKKNIKLIVPLLSVLCVGGLASCSNPIYGEPPTSIRLSRLNLGLLMVEEIDEAGVYTGKIVGEEYQVQAETLPHQEHEPHLNYSSSDEKVAKVDDKGKVTAIGPGKCEIIVKGDGEEAAEAKLPVFVAESCSKGAANKVVDSIKEVQATDPAYKVDTLRSLAYWKNTRTKNGKPFEVSRFDRTTVVSKSSAYMYMADDSSYIKAEDGSISYEADSWTIYTTASYDTYLFHTVGTTRTYMVADATSFIDEGKSRFDATCAVLDSLFTAGSSLITGMFDECLGTEQYGALSSVSSSKRRGSLGGGELIMSTAQSASGYEADREDEEDMYIPAGTLYDLELGHDYVLTDNYVKSDKLYQNLYYKLGEDEYSNCYDIEYDYQIKGVELTYPEREQFTKVDTIFDL